MKKNICSGLFTGINTACISHVKQYHTDIPLDTTIEIFYIQVSSDLYFHLIAPLSELQIPGFVIYLFKIILQISLVVHFDIADQKCLIC